MSPQLTSRVYPLRLPLIPDEEKGWKRYPIFDGFTADLRTLSCHVSVLTQHRCPHPPHRHDEEEILLLLAGEVDLILPDMQPPNGEPRKRLRRGEFVYYPPQFSHTLQTVGEDPANYLMFKWYNHGSATGTDSRLAFGHFTLCAPAEKSEVEAGSRRRLVFEGPTACLRRLHCHASTLTPAAGYEPHSDDYTVAIIVLEGEVETLGERAGPHGVIFYSAGEPHGMRNRGETTARYVVFEFHGRRRALLGKFTDPQYWKRNLKHLVRGFGGRAQ